MAKGKRGAIESTANGLSTQRVQVGDRGCLKQLELWIAATVIASV